MGLNKKAIIFTFIGILVVALFSVIFLARYESPIDRKNDVIRVRVQRLNEFVEDFEVYSENTLSVVSIKAIEGILWDIDERNDSIYNFEQAFIECTLNGTLGNGDRDCPNMPGNTLADWFDKIHKIANDKLFINFTYSFENLSISQTQYWYLDVSLDLKYSINDTYASWGVAKSLETDVSIEGFRDPLYLINGSTENIITRNDVIGIGQNITMFEEFIEEGQYRVSRSSDSPSFWMRMEGETSESDGAGIFSLVNPKDFNNDTNRSYVDFLFFNATKFKCGQGQVYAINDLSTPYTKLKIDLDHAQEFQFNFTQLNDTC
ncbi:MAG: hypothetical protein ABIE94_05135 [archaeon]